MVAPKIAAHRRGKLDAAGLNIEIARTWENLLASKVGREQIAAALGVNPADIQPQQFKPIGPPFSVDGASGIGTTPLLIGGEWLLTSVVVPVLVGLVKDEVKERLTRLWKNVLLPRLQSEGAIKDSVS